MKILEFDVLITENPTDIKVNAVDARAKQIKLRDKKHYNIICGKNANSLEPEDNVSKEARIGLDDKLFQTFDDSSITLCPDRDFKLVPIKIRDGLNNKDKLESNEQGYLINRHGEVQNYLTVADELGIFDLPNEDILVIVNITSVNTLKEVKGSVLDKRHLNTDVGSLNLPLTFYADVRSGLEGFFLVLTPNANYSFTYDDQLYRLANTPNGIVIEAIQKKED